MITFNKLPSTENETNILHYQKELVFLLNYLLDKGYAKKTGEYKNGSGKIPLFNHNSSGGVISVPKKTGYKLLFEGIEIQQVNPIEKLMTWIIDKFPLIKQSANSQYNTKLDSQKHIAQIIAGAAHYLYKQENSEIVQKPSIQEKIIFGLSGFAFVLLVVYLYAKSPNIYFEVLSTSLFLTGVVSLISLLILNASKKSQPKLLKLGLTTAFFSFLIGAYQTIILSLDWNGKLAATFIIFPVIILLVFKAVYLLTFALSQKNKDSTIYVIYESLERIKSNIFRLDEVAFLLVIASVGILIMANLSIVLPSLSSIVK